MGKPQADVYLDAKGLNCPMPVLKTKKALDSMQVGQTLYVETTDKGSKKDITAILNRTGNELLESGEDGNVFTFLIKKVK